jgi:hypothetical protein
VVDLAGPRADGRLVAVARFRLYLVSRSGAISRFARGPRGYAGRPEGEPYLALARERRLRRPHCSFKRDDLYVLQPGRSPAVIRVSRRGRARRFVALPRGGFPDGIAFDTVGSFGRRLLVTSRFGERNAVYSMDCRGRRRTVARRVPRLEGGMAVAPGSFGRFGGRLIAVDELSGRIYAIDARGRSRTLARSGLPAGSDRGLESLGFVPGGLRHRIAYLADLSAGPSSPTRGTGSILRVGGRALARAGVRSGDLLVVTEAGARTVAVRCRRRCTVHGVTSGPAAAHAEGHVVFGPSD